MEKQVVAEVSVVPIGTGDTSVSKYVAACLEVLEKVPDLSYQLTAMGTIIQGSLQQVFQVVKEMHEAPFSLGVSRVVTTVKIDDRRDKSVTISGKVEAVRKLVPTVKA